MNLLDKINTINQPTLPILPTKAHHDTIEQFFEHFVKDMLPKENVIKAWHKLLMDYVKDLSNLSCCVRFGNVGDKKPSSQGETGYYKLRRGWLTRNDSDRFEYFFADNFFSYFIYKLALDGYVPTQQEFADAFKNHKFPYGFGFFIDKKINEYKGAVIPTAHEPGFLGKYKLSHIFDAGKYFDVDGGCRGDAYLSELYYPIGHSNDYLNHPDHVRVMHITDDAKKVIKAKFLRFAHPFNYFVTPRKKNHICGEKVFDDDIGEDPRMINYMRQYLKSTYPDEYAEFVKAIMWFESSPSGCPATGKEVIDITFGSEVSKQKAHGRPRSNDPRQAKYPEIELAKYFLEHDDTYSQLDKDYLKCPTDRHGGTSFSILRKLGLATKDRGILKRLGMSDLIATASGKRKETLEKVLELTK